VWAPGVATREDAFHHVDDVVLSLLADTPAPRVVDLGCGVGGSLLHLAARRADLVGEGITISPAQVATATTLLARAGVADRVRVREGDFVAPPADLAGADLALSVEAFVHGPDPGAYLRAAAGILRPGGLLVLCDDVLTARGARPSPQEAARLDTFRRGWRIGSLLTVEELLGLAAAEGLEPVRDDDLTPFLELRRPRDRVLAVVVRAARPLPLRGEYWRSLVGGDALQRCLGSGLLAYRLLVLQRPS
jgi:SAM-dependent methyltransferase